MNATLSVLTIAALILNSLCGRTPSKDSEGKGKPDNLYVYSEKKINDCLKKMGSSRHEIDELGRSPDGGELWFMVRGGYILRMSALGSTQTEVPTQAQSQPILDGAGKICAYWKPDSKVISCDGRDVILPERRLQFSTWGDYLITWDPLRSDVNEIRALSAPERVLCSGFSLTYPFSAFSLSDGLLIVYRDMQGAEPGANLVCTRYQRIENRLEVRDTVRCYHPRLSFSGGLTVEDYDEERDVLVLTWQFPDLPASLWKQGRYVLYRDRGEFQRIGNSLGYAFFLREDILKKSRIAAE